MTVLAAAGEVGGAKAIVPVLRDLMERSDVHVRIMASGAALAHFQLVLGAGAVVGVSPEDADEAWAQDVLTVIRPDVLLLGAAWGPSLERVLIKASKVRRIPVLSLVDTWSNYRKRFADASSGELILPEAVAVPDRLAYEEALEAGLPEAVLTITGQPHLETLRARRGDESLQEAASRLRDSWLEEPGGSVQDSRSRILLLASEPVSRDWGPGTPYYPGYTEVDALAGLAEAARAVEERTGVPVRLVCKLHPDETEAEVLRSLPPAHPILIVGRDSLSEKYAVAADVVIGMTSMFLVEGACLGRPVISFQPGDGAGGEFIGTRLGLCGTARTGPELLSLIESALEDGGDRHRGESGIDFVRDQSGAARRVATVLLSLVCQVAPLTASESS